jgi:hypothetical protein
MNGNLSKRIPTERPQNTLPALRLSNSPSAARKQVLVSLLTRQELAERWRCCPHTIARNKQLRPIRLGNRLVRYRLTDVEAIEAAASGE